MSHIKDLKDFYEKNRDKDYVVVSLKEDDIFKYIEEILDFTDHKVLYCERGLDRWTLKFSK